LLAPASRLLTTPRRARARDRQTKPFASASALALASSPSSRAGPENQLPNASRLVASTRGLRRVVTRVSLAYPLAGILEPQKEVDSRLVVCAVSKSIYRGRVTDPRVTLFGYGDNKYALARGHHTIWKRTSHDPFILSTSHEPERPSSKGIWICMELISWTRASALFERSQEGAL